ncbi:glycosyltransferase family 4 protein [Sedimentibacter sp. MB31-C6]|uniref:glycosyltransferase family 4 protein n=1 Tax=Sedimentibacter sp. MB31-C6 TaxID=3109366 RepID=UPI002DDCD15F|nr:glycosyltransferase family 4 protein [Sedimentibacter sp. MB36-C1]WSI03565.1 glycosyltransferase family 4 protein [Sedimentibacter sp. MB36-C1]
MNLNKIYNGKKICHMTSGHKRYDVRIFKKECTSLADFGLDITLLVNDNKPDEVINNVKIISTKYVPKNRFSRMIFSNRNFYKMAVDIDADIYHFHDPELLPVGNKLKKIGKKVIFDAHENYIMQIKEKYYIPKLFRSVISCVYGKYESFSVKRFDSVIFPCTLNNMNPFEKKAKKTVFIDNVPVLSELYNKYKENESKQERLICYVGGLTYQRGITHLIKAAYKARTKLILGGILSPLDYSNEIKKMKEFSCVDYKGYVKHDKVVDIYKQSSIGICTILNVGQYNKGDNFPTKVYEYMSMGLPVIISDYPYVRKVFKQYKFGIAVHPENVDEIADAIIYLLNNPEIALKMGQEGRRAVKERFNWNIEEKKLLELYEKLIE